MSSKKCRILWREVTKTIDQIIFCEAEIDRLLLVLSSCELKKMSDSVKRSHRFASSRTRDPGTFCTSYSPYTLRELAQKVLCEHDRSDHILWSRDRAVIIGFHFLWAQKNCRILWREVIHSLVPELRILGLFPQVIHHTPFVSFCENDSSDHLLWRIDRFCRKLFTIHPSCAFSKMIDQIIFCEA